LENVFVYGTLKKGKENNGLLTGQIQMGEGETVNLFAMFDLGPFPMVTEDEVSVIQGEVYRIPDDILDKMDMLEGELYDRIVTQIKLKDSGTVEAWMFVESKGGETEDGILIGDGNWR
jgi:gamma-glutamylcyclotransferase (GGCT)/AIG2-like uncharacterized protein YtfP